MRPVPGVAQACRIVPVPGNGDLILEGPADFLDGIRLAPLDDGPGRSGCSWLAGDDAAAGATLDWVRVLVQSRYGAHHPSAPRPPT